MISYQDLVTFLGPLLMGGLGWWVKSLRSDINQAASGLHLLAIKVAEEYVHKNTLHDIKDALIRIENKLDLKQDKQ